MKDLEEVFRELLGAEPASGSAVAVYRNGEEVLSLCGGLARPGVSWTPETAVPVFSATKAVASACLLNALAEQGLDAWLEIGKLWPGFPLRQATVADLLSHRLGLAALPEPLPMENLEAFREAFERSCPNAVYGYHPQTFGPLVDILMQQLTGARVCDYWEQRIRRPWALELYLGHVPEEVLPRIAHLQPPRLPGGKMPTDEFYRAYFDANSSVYRAFHSVKGYDSPRDMNTVAAWCCGSPAKGGVASARGLCRFYQLLMNREPDSPFAPQVAQWMGTRQAGGFDHTLLRHTAFGCGVMMEPAELFPGGGFGHAGAGGCHAFCVPGLGLSFAYVMNRMQLGILPGERVQRLLAAIHIKLPH